MGFQADGGFLEQGLTTRPAVSSRVRRWTLISILAALAIFAGYLALEDFMEKSAIDFRSAEEIVAKLHAGGFECENAFFPKGSNEPTGYSTATCERGFALVHVIVNQERGQWPPVDPPRYKADAGHSALVAGRNWVVSSEATSRDSFEIAKEVHAILGGTMGRSVGQKDY